MRVSRVIDVPGLEVLIKAAREADSRSITELAAAAGMTTSNWYKIESGKPSALPVETLRKIEEVLGTDFGVKI
jgi:transcriptional regulator with XRE-family HTH domain